MQMKPVIPTQPPVMASLRYSQLLFLFLLLLCHPPFSKANLHRNKLFRPGLLSRGTPLNDTPPNVYFEVTKPIELPKVKPCSYLVLQHDFGYTYGKPPVVANYTPPSNCRSKQFSKIVFEWTATCKGTQFDRIFGVWLGGVELLRSCTAEPTATGIFWRVEKDITRYYSLLMKNQTLAVYLGNLIDSTYTGVYHVNITIHFYPEVKSDNSLLKHDSPADLILPLSRNLPLNDGLWFEIENFTDVALKEFKIPQNSYRSVMEVYVSFHENDEFWYSNLPNDYIEANNLTGTPGNGPFREVVVSLDGEVVGAIWPFTVIYTGGVIPLLWTPVTGIGSFDLPSYNIEITPFLGRISDGKAHTFAFSVTNALNGWFIDANLHLWLDRKSTKIEGKLLMHISSPLVVSGAYDFQGLNGTFLTNVRRSISSTGWLKSSYGNITTHWIQNFGYNNTMVLGKNGNFQIVNQTIHFNDSVQAKILFSSVYSMNANKKYTLYLYSDYLDQGNDNFLYIANVMLGFNEKKSEGTGFELSKSSLINAQNAQSNIAVKDDLISGLSNTQQVYKYDSCNFCYFRNISSSNDAILYDKLADRCPGRTKSNFDFGLSRWWRSPSWSAFLASSLVEKSRGV